MLAFVLIAMIVTRLVHRDPLAPAMTPTLMIPVAPKIFRRDIHFTPAWWTIGFPMAALANAAPKYADHQGGGPLGWLATALLGALSLALAVLTVRTARIVANGQLFS